jgi:hypothetical protein
MQMKKPACVGRFEALPTLLCAASLLREKTTERCQRRGLSKKIAELGLL